MIFNFCDIVSDILLIHEVIILVIAKMDSHKEEMWILVFLMSYSIFFERMEIYKLMKKVQF